MARISKAALQHYRDRAPACLPAAGAILAVLALFAARSLRSRGSKAGSGPHAPDIRRSARPDGATSSTPSHRVDSRRRMNSVGSLPRPAVKHREARRHPLYRRCYLSQLPPFPQAIDRGHLQEVIRQVHMQMAFFENEKKDSTPSDRFPSRWATCPGMHLAWLLTSSQSPLRPGLSFPRQVLAQLVQHRSIFPINVDSTPVRTVDLDAEDVRADELPEDDS